MATLREAHFCLTCEFRLPYCVRSDREFCGERCRGWWYPTSGSEAAGLRTWGCSDRAKEAGQPKTLAEALVALAELRVHAERLEADARKRSTQQHKQRNNWSELSLSLTKGTGAISTGNGCAQRRSGESEEQLAESEQRAKESGGTEKELRAQVAELKAELERAKQSEKNSARRTRNSQGSTKRNSRRSGEVGRCRCTIKELHEVADALSGNLIEEQKLRAAAEVRGDKLSQDIEEMLTGSRFR